MAAELGPDWQNSFEEFERQAAAAASLGQVHRAVLNGVKLACKLQYPDMNSAVEADLAQLKLIFAVYQRYDRTIDTTNVHKEISERLREELDYDRERRHIELFAEILKGEKNIHVPEVKHSLSTKRLLTMNWLDGRPLLEFREADLETRNKIALNMFRAWYVPFYSTGVIHGDPHLGNYSIRQNLDINLLDFGCIRVFDATFVQGVIDLYCAVRDDNQDLAVHAYQTWGFTDLNNEVIETLNLWANFVYGPLLEDRSRRIREDNESGVYGKDVAEKVHRGLRELGGVRPPQEFVFMDRAAIGLGGVFMHLNAEVNWFRHFHDLIDGFNPVNMKRKQNRMLKRFNLDAPSPS